MFYVVDCMNLHFNCFCEFYVIYAVNISVNIFYNLAAETKLKIYLAIDTPTALPSA